MPNWNANNLVIEASTPEQSLLLAKIAANPTKLFNSFLSMPKDVLNGTADQNWYDWSITNWGTKWDVDADCVTVHDNNTVELSFDTAWCPPIALYDWLVEQGWKIRATYYEPGMGFAGIYENGDDRCYEDLTQEWLDDNDDAVELDDFYGISDDISVIED